MTVYAKFFVALAGALVMALASAFTDDVFTNPEKVQVAIAVATAAGVWIAANTPGLTWAKTAVAVVLAVLNLLVSYISNGVSHAEWLNLAVAALTAAGVYAVRNTSKA